MRHRDILTAVPLVACLFAGCDAATPPAGPPPSKVAPATPAESAKESPKSDTKKAPTYDESADAAAQVQAALAAAKRENRRVLVQWGANWCKWCVKMHDLFQSDKTIAKELRYEYDVVFVDVGKMDKNLDLAKNYDADFKNHGIPWLTILDADGKPLANQSTDIFEVDGKQVASGHDPKKMLEFLTKHQAKPLDAQAELTKAMDLASKTDRAVFVHFGAPWCGWCVKLDHWLAQPEVASVVAKDLVELKIDQDRMTGGKELLDKYRKNSQGGIPWFAILDRQGTLLVTSDGPKGNIGFPGEPDEIVHFLGMLRKVQHQLTEEEIQGLGKSLTEFNAAPNKAH